VNPLSLSRGAAWLGVVLVGWSLNIRWGANEYLGNGPPATLHRHVVGALLLAGIAALALSVSRRWQAQVVAAATAAGVALLVWRVHSRGPESVLGGPGWRWMAMGAVLLAAAVGAAALFGRGAGRSAARADRPRRRSRK
jgi:hypothetical protein